MAHDKDEPSDQEYDTVVKLQVCSISFAKVQATDLLVEPERRQVSLVSVHHQCIETGQYEDEG